MGLFGDFWTDQVNEHTDANGNIDESSLRNIAGAMSDSDEEYTYQLAEMRERVERAKSSSYSSSYGASSFVDDNNKSRSRSNSDYTAFSGSDFSSKKSSAPSTAASTRSVHAAPRATHVPKSPETPKEPTSAELYQKYLDYEYTIKKTQGEIS